MKASLNNGGTLAHQRLVDDPKWKPARFIVIPPQSAAVVV